MDISVSCDGDGGCVTGTGQSPFLDEGQRQSRRHNNTNGEPCNGNLTLPRNGIVVTKK